MTKFIEGDRVDFVDSEGAHYYLPGTVVQVLPTNAIDWSQNYYVVKWDDLSDAGLHAEARLVKWSSSND